MYSIVLMAAMTTSPATPEFGRGGCRGGDGCHGGCNGGGGIFGRRGGRHGCHGGGCYGGGYGGGCYGGGYGGCQGGWGGYSGGCHGGVGVGCSGGYSRASAGVYTPGGTYMAGPYLPANWMPMAETVPIADGAPTAATRATMIVTLPADAKLVVDSNPTTSQGAVREFVTPSLDPAQDFSYFLVATCIVNGQDAGIQ